jgi:tRNA-specific 2-thiouridylase
MLGEGRGLITLAESAFAIAPGQAGVIYDKDRVLGGGWITTKER